MNALVEPLGSVSRCQSWKYHVDPGVIAVAGFVGTCVFDAPLAAQGALW